MTALRALSPFTRPGAAEPALERCDMCAEPIDERHQHIVDLERRAIRCSCRACALLFAPAGAGSGRYRLVPDRVLVAVSPGPSASAWAELGVPVGLAFLFFHSGRERWVAVYPSPAGPVESVLAPGAAAELAGRAPLAALVEPDVEALLVHTPRGAPPECFLVPIAACYELAAAIRRVWTGLDGGPAARAALDEFIRGLRRRARPSRGG